MKTQKWVESKVDESVLKTTTYTKQWVNRTIQYSSSHISPNSYTSLHLITLIYTSQPTPPKFPPFAAFSWSSPQFNSLPFTPLFNFQPLFLEILDFLRTSKSFHFTYHFPNLLPIHTWFSRTSKSFNFTSLLTFQPLFQEVLDFVLTLNSLHFISLHFAYHFSYRLPKGARFGGEIS